MQIDPKKLPVRQQGYSAAFDLEFTNSAQLKVVFFICYSVPRKIATDTSYMYEWDLVTRDHCKNGCPVRAHPNRNLPTSQTLQGSYFDSLSLGELMSCLRCIKMLALLVFNYFHLLCLADADQKTSAMQGPILRPIQRLGKLGKRSNVPQTETADPNQTKDPKFVYLSIDECGSHVGNRKTTFFRCAH